MYILFSQCSLALYINAVRKLFRSCHSDYLQDIIFSFRIRASALMLILECCNIQYTILITTNVGMCYNCQLISQPTPAFIYFNTVQRNFFKKINYKRLLTHSSTRQTRTFSTCLGVADPLLHGVPSPLFQFSAFLFLEKNILIFF